MELRDTRRGITAAAARAPSTQQNHGRALKLFDKFLAAEGDRAAPHPPSQLSAAGKTHKTVVESDVVIRELWQLYMEYSVRAS